MTNIKEKRGFQKREKKEKTQKYKKRLKVTQDRLKAKTDEQRRKIERYNSLTNFGESGPDSKFVSR